MFVVKSYGSFQNKSFRLPVEVVKDLERIAGEKNLSVNALVLQMIEHCLKDLSQLNEEGK